MEFNIQTASRDDIKDITRIESLVFSMPWDEGVLESRFELEGSEGFVARVEGKIVSYILFDIVLDEAHIIRLATHPDFRRKGIAKSLVLKMLGYLKEKGVKSVFLEVRESNISSIKLYESMGFSVLNKRQAYYQHPVEDALIMVKRLD